MHLHADKETSSASTSQHKHLYMEANNRRSVAALCWKQKSNAEFIRAKALATS